LDVTTRWFAACICQKAFEMYEERVQCSKMNLNMDEGEECQVKKIGAI